MLFNSYSFLLFFLPAVCLVFYALGGMRAIRLAAAFLAAASVVFYGYWSPRYILLLLASIAANYCAGLLLLRATSRNDRAAAKRILITAIALDLGLLGYFKYANFFVDTLRHFTALDLPLAQIVLPIGISFYTFTQIAFLVDTYQGKVREARLVPYILFVTYFPHLVAGPVLHHAEMMPQFSRNETYRFQLPNVLSGMTLLIIGLFKKVILADGIQPFVTRAFNAPPEYALGGVEAWGAVLAYTLQLYFDFSGYSDMAIGMSRMLNVELPLNFDSPYKSRSIIDFWRRWHMTLSRFLRDYLYIPLGGSRLGEVRRYINLFVTMLLGGLWHGAGWTFVVWGALHGIYLAINHGWRALVQRVAVLARLRGGWLATALALPLTLACVVVAWTFFRADSVHRATDMLQAMGGGNGWALPIEWRSSLISISGGAAAGWHYAPLSAFVGLRQVIWILVLLLITQLAPNSQQVMQRLTASGLFQRRGWLPWVLCGAMVAVVLMLAIVNGSRGVSEFIYFNF